MPSSFISQSSPSADNSEKPGLDIAKLKYLRYRCREFYLCLGMALECQYESESKVVLGFAFKTSNQEFNDMNTTILLEYDKRGDAFNVVRQDATDMGYGHKYLVVYVHFLARIVKRLTSKGTWHIFFISGFNVVHEIRTNDDLSITTFIDPNEIDIRLIECTPTQLNELQGQGNKNFTQTFSSSKSGKKHDRGGSNTNHYDFNNKRQEGKDSLIRNGFHVTDSETLLSGMSYTLFTWLGCDSREKASSICYVERIAASSATKKLNWASFKDPVLIGFGFTLPILDVGIQILKTVHPEIKFEGEKLPVGELGIYSFIRDPMNYELGFYSPFDTVSLSVSTEEKRRQSIMSNKIISPFLINGENSIDAENLEGEGSAESVKDNLPKENQLNTEVQNKEALKLPEILNQPVTKVKAFNRAYNSDTNINHQSVADTLKRAKSE
ncbi:hypothetical protein ROZALSC1DRAFT_27361 [Rozella allomycis CSF55]|uniref:Uncharacterized protein n=1 Tax=Rozella allomycis (strain CSF55) TaxID=988480 RepID=A0A075B4N3_ROZAC|nr:hypothetical protein O9G_004750 [Rozella allomycis CSF55]RKP21209.1 hypothetical protein ROZALSC1DRAFT_27358 [Rozella allomycis CSF55]RKP21215.1 hypothetical protein ROZALSC1DRAFT_27361 [Rozella allomycis CSF55]|eukprot:EPZ36322.1 hypothetical protein O9G_004750 [Rozella allomycis CSF55]